MRVLPITLFASLVLLLSVAAHASEAKKELRVAYLKSHMKDGKINPIMDHYYRNMLGGAMGVDVVWVGPLPFVRVLANLKDGSIDMFYAMSKTEEREEYIDYPSFPSWVDLPVFVVPKESAIKVVDKISDLHDLRIGYCTKMVVPAFAEDERVKMENLNHDDWGVSTLKMLKMGRLDLAFFPSHQMCDSFKDKIDFDFDLVFREIVPSQEVIGATLGNHYEGFSKTSSKHFLEKYVQVVKKIGIFQEYYLQAK